MGAYSCPNLVSTSFLYNPYIPFLIFRIFFTSMSSRGSGHVLKYMLCIYLVLKCAYVKVHKLPH